MRIIKTISLTVFLASALVFVQANSNKINDLREKVEELSVENKTLQSTISTQNEKIETLTDDNEELLIEINEMKVRVRKLEQQRLEAIEKQKQKQKRQEQIKQQQITTNGQSLGQFKITHYSAKCKGCTGITKSGFELKGRTKYEGMDIIATDNKIIPLGSIVLIKSKDRTIKAIVLDKGGAIKNRDIDLLVSSQSEAYKKGVYYAELSLIRKGW